MSLRVFLTAAAALLAGCAGVAQQPELPALIVALTPASEAELQTAVSGMLGVAAVRLAPDALTTTSWLAVEREPARDAQGTPLGGRDLGRPELFDLIRAGELCVLVHRGSGARVVLREIRCRGI